MSTTSVQTRPSPFLGLVVVAVVVVLAGAALVTPGAAQDEPLPTTAPVATTAPTASTTVPPTTVPVPAPAPTGASTSATVHDVLLVGDSIMRSTGPALAHQLGARWRVHNEGVNGSGLLTPGVFNWSRHLPASLSRFDPDIVVMLFIGNYTADPAQKWVGADGRQVPDIYTRSFAREWGRQAERFVTQMIGSGADVVLVLPPPMISARVQIVTDRLRAEYRAVAARHPEVTLADATTAVGGPHGEWVATRPTASGGWAPVRLADTVHLAAHGRGLVAREIRFGIVRARS
ncbi:MAG TPA: GDSL-type esterase/lipase family protein [Acidimicrobiales bacterium]